VPHLLARYVKNRVLPRHGVLVPVARHLVRVERIRGIQILDHKRVFDLPGYVQEKNCFIPSAKWTAVRRHARVSNLTNERS